MHSTKLTKQIIVICASLLLISSALFAQVLEPKIDEVHHLSDVKEIDVSLDKKYFATADADGVLTFRDIETGKVISTKDYNGTIEDIAFTENEGELIVIFTFGYEDNTITEIQKVNFIQNTSKSLIDFTNIEVYGVDFNVGTDQALIALLEGNPILIDYENKSVDTIFHDSEYNNASFDENDNCIIYSEDEEGTSLKVFQYNPDSKTVYPIKDLGEAQLDIDLSNKLSYIKDDQFVFIDYKLNFRASISTEGLIVGDESIVHDFAFSPDGKYITLVGGEGTEEFMSMVGLRTEVTVIGTGFVALYDVNESRKIWQTERGDQQPVFDVKDLGWVDNESFIVADEKGNIFTMGVEEDTYFDMIPLPRRVITYADINKDFSSIIYSQKENASYQFDISDDGRREKIADWHSPRISMSSNNISATAGLYVQPGGVINDHVQGLDRIQHYPDLIQDCFVDIALANNGSAYAVSTGMLSAAWINMITNPVVSVGLDKMGTIKKIETPEYVLMAFNNETLANLVPQNSSTNQINLSNTNCTVVFYLDDFRKPLVIYDQEGQLEFSNNGKYLSIKTDDNFNPQYRILDLDTQEWLRQQDGSKSFLYNKFSEHHPYAYSIRKDKESVVWNTENDETIFQGNIVFEGFEPNSPVSDQIENVAKDFHRFLKNVSFTPDGGTVLMQLDLTLYILDTHTGLTADVGGGFEFINSSLSPDGKIGYSEEFDSDSYRTKSLLNDLISGNTIFEKPFVESYDYQSRQSITGDIFFHETKPLAFLHNAHGTFYLVDLNLQAIIATLKFFENGEWLVYTPQGLFDGSKFARNSLYYTFGNEVILFDQIKDRYWEPDLLNKIINNPGLIQTDVFGSDISLYPRARLSMSDASGLLNVELDGPESKVGAVSLFVNGKEVETDINAQKKKSISVNILQDAYRKYLFPEGANTVSVITYNSEGSIASRPYSVYLNSNLAKDKGTGEENQVATTSRRRRRSTSAKKPGLFGLFVGTSEYQNEKLKLSYADKDAKDLRKAFSLISKDMYDQNRIELTTLYSESTNPDSLATKQNILREFANMEAKANANDIIVLFFSGHGLTIDNDFYYLTSTAGKVDLRANAEERSKTCVSSKEIKEGLRKIRSNKQIMILDACHSGQITKIFEANDKATSTTLNKALENLEDKMGVYVLASSESNQKSFETETLQQGLLTFALKYGMSGEASEDQIIDVAELLTFASINAEQIGKSIMGKSQRPVLGITQGGNPFPVGIKNETLKVDLPQKKIKFTTPRFLVLTTLADPRKVAKAVRSKLETRGGIGTSENFIYSRNEYDTEAIVLAGSYKVEGSNIVLQWNLLKEEQVWKGPINKTIELSDFSIIGNIIIDESLKLIE